VSAASDIEQQIRLDKYFSVAMLAAIRDKRNE